MSVEEGVVWAVVSFVFWCGGCLGCYLTKRRRALLAHGGPPAYAASFLRLAERPPGAHVFFGADCTPGMANLRTPTPNFFVLQGGAGG